MSCWIVRLFVLKKYSLNLQKAHGYSAACSERPKPRSGQSNQKFDIRKILGEPRSFELPSRKEIMMVVRLSNDARCEARLTIEQVDLYTQ